MKKIFTILAIVTTILPNLALAQGASPNGTPGGGAPGISEKINDFFERKTLYAEEEENKKNLLKNLTKSEKEETFSDVYSSIAKIMLAVATLLIFIALVVAGVIMVTGQGEENAITKAKQIVIYALIAVVLIAAAYAITIGITRIKPF